jgi:Mn2+/Fe2+ NRAMP family transporter
MSRRAVTGGAALEISLAIPYNIAQGFGWEWSEDKKPIKAARFNLALTLFLLVGLVIGLSGGDPLQLALLASTVIALFLPFSLSPFLVIMNDPDYLRSKTNGRFTNVAMIVVLVLASVVAVVSIPLLLLSGGG